MESDSDQSESAPESESPSPEPEVIPTTQSKSKGKSPKKKSSQPGKEHGKHEGTDPHWAYKPPPGAVLLDHEVDAGEFEWDNVEEDEDVELWLIRIPEGLKPKYLENLKIDPPPATQSARLGTLDRKHATFDIWSVAGSDDRIGGEEIKGLSCLLPRMRKKGKLYQIPKPIAHHLVVSARAVLPTPDPSCERTPGGAPIYKNPSRQNYPKELLKHRFLPYGSQTADYAVDADVEMEVVDDGGEIEVVTQSQEEAMSRKRKGHDMPKKVKKARRAA